MFCIVCTDFVRPITPSFEEKKLRFCFFYPFNPSYVKLKQNYTFEQSVQQTVAKRAHDGPGTHHVIIAACAALFDRVRYYCTRVPISTVITRSFFLFFFSVFTSLSSESNERALDTHEPRPRQQCITVAVERGDLPALRPVNHVRQRRTGRRWKNR